MSSVRRQMSRIVRAPVAIMEPDKSSKHYPIWKFFRDHIIWVIVLIAYSFIGAAVLEKLESEYERTERQNVLNSREKMVETLWKALNISDNSTKEAWKKKFEIELNKFFKIYKTGIQPAVSSIEERDEEFAWTFWGAMLFCGTVYTTIGYGYLAPKTVPGRVFSMAYAGFGIPLCLIVLANFGKLCTDGLNRFWSKVSNCKTNKRCACCKTKSSQGPLNETENFSNINKDSPKSSISNIEELRRFERKRSHPSLSSNSDSIRSSASKPERSFEERKRSVLISISLVAVYIVVGAAIYTSWEEWEYFDAIYFIFISLTTVGLGDVYPNHPKYFILSSVYMFFGLALVSMVVNLIMINTRKNVEKNLKTIGNKVEKKVVARQNSHPVLNIRKKALANVKSADI
ncbi:DgyrCDS3134 [Dimorphilus gyrociliatus]|uniref:DgyrCDS3134 n=1 Tax=Dimorphilus gyrociliatus TaxID=2664684 RepID=A0A7I8VC94_9ANNE|nr:DgyrCDS3134 [Dimorphilus gyrociliatus]